MQFVCMFSHLCPTTTLQHLVYNFFANPSPCNPTPKYTSSKHGHCCIFNKRYIYIYNALSHKCSIPQSTKLEHEPNPLAVCNWYIILCKYRYVYIYVYSYIQHVNITNCIQQNVKLNLDQAYSNAAGIAILKIDGESSTQIKVSTIDRQSTNTRCTRCKDRSRQSLLTQS